MYPNPLPRLLNLGCGFDHRAGWLNVDGFKACKPDRLIDLEQFPWDLPSDYFEQILIKHVLEHLGASFAVFEQVMREIYRVAAAGAMVEIHVPHHKHDNFWSDPTHVRAFTPLTFQMMSKKQCDDWIARGVGNTMLAHLIQVDFEVVEMVQVFDPAWYKRHTDGLMSIEQLREGGFVPHCFVEIKRWSIAPAVRNNDIRIPFNQLLESDIVYIRDPLKVARWDAESVKKLILLALEALG